MATAHQRQITRREAILTASAWLGTVSLTGVRAAIGTAGPAGPGESIDWSEVDRRLRAKVEDGTFAGVGLLLATPEETLCKRSFGADTTETRHLLGSATKLTSTTTIMTLVDDRLLALDDPISKFLPRFGRNRGAVTLRQLLSQTHGIPAHHPAIARPQEDNGLTLAEAVDRIADDDGLDFTPASRHRYQPAASYHIAGRIAEVVTGQEWAVLFEERVKGPLEMSGFSYGDTPNPRIGGGAQCALQDYGNLLQMHLSGGRFKGVEVLSAASVEEMQRDQLHGVPFTAAREHEAHGYGLCWWFDVLDEMGHPLQVSVPGVYGAIPWLHRRLRYAGFLLVKKRLRESSALYREIYPLINAELGGRRA